MSRRRHRRHRGHHHGHHRELHKLWPFAWRVHHSLRRRMFRGFSLAILVSAAIGYGVWILIEPHRLAVAGAGIAALIVLWSASGAIAWAVTRPLVELVSVTRDLGEGKLDRRMHLRSLAGPHARGRRSGGREIAILAESVNTMAARIEAQIAGQRELLAGVSHELRTPLGHMRVLIDTAREDEGLAPAQAQTLDELEREVIELDGLVDQLLAHSRLEFDRVERRELDPVSLAVRALERVAEDASKLEVESERERITGDPTLLGRALANLITNARSHGRGLTCLRIRDGDAGELWFEVEDRGPGFAAGEEERMFDSFVQGERGRGGSLGLGLALVHRIAVAHGGRAQAANLPAGGARVGLCVTDFTETSVEPSS